MTRFFLCLLSQVFHNYLYRMMQACTRMTFVRYAEIFFPIKNGIWRKEFLCICVGKQTILLSVIFLNENYKSCEAD